jgi:lincosamide and streptogramin A transport system ATP-binding/permease protein
LDETIFFTNLAQLGVAGEHFDEDAASFSDGQKKKVLLAISITKSAHVYIWDEPLNYIDVISREQIEKMLLKYAPTLIYVEHDASFNENIATKRIELN